MPATECFVKYIIALSSAVADQPLELASEVANGFGGIAPIRGQRTFELRLRLGAVEDGGQLRAAAAVDSQGRVHEAAPNLGRNGPAADSAQGLVVVAAKPHADHQIAGEADEQSVAVLLGCAG